MSLSAATTSDTTAHAQDGCLEPRRANGMSPSDHHTDLPSRPPYTPPTNSGGGYVARRSAGESPKTGRSGFFSLAAPSLRRTPSLGSRRAASSSPLQPPLPGRQALRRATRNTDGPPPLPPPPLIVLPLPKGLGNPPARLQPITHLLRAPDPTLSRFSAEHAQNAAALTYSRAQKAGEPEPA
ncbi:formin-like protein 5 [Mustela erminea]|uniref:formin-like protein 5 n=1 Tax=Mustela erminea TaxID=36723 RepID=UPI00138705DD|nr:formin-like protein 5 [Mustela erminea]